MTDQTAADVRSLELRQMATLALCMDVLRLVRAASPAATAAVLAELKEDAEALRADGASDDEQRIQAMRCAWFEAAAFPSDPQGWPEAGGGVGGGGHA